MDVSHCPPPLGGSRCLRVTAEPCQGSAGRALSILLRRAWQLVAGRGGRDTVSPTGTQLCACSQAPTCSSSCAPASEEMPAFTQDSGQTPHHHHPEPPLLLPRPHISPGLSTTSRLPHCSPGYPVPSNSLHGPPLPGDTASPHQQPPLLFLWHALFCILCGSPQPSAETLASWSGTQGHGASGLLSAHLPTPSLITFPSFTTACSLPNCTWRSLASCLCTCSSLPRNTPKLFQDAQTPLLRCLPHYSLSQAGPHARALHPRHSSPFVVNALSCVLLQVAGQISRARLPLPSVWVSNPLAPPSGHTGETLVFH